ncbi:MAG: glutaredoxin family protein [Burkholderiaceae bacterium]|jgi:glutaredoxin|nr:glutaredoxin family protein [Burkholderiaceae bacterium]
MRFRAILPFATLTATVAATLLAAAPAWAQLYRSVGPDGRVTYSDTPPSAASARNGENSGSNRNSGGYATAALPYALTQVAQKYPVTLYASQGCAPCDSGRNLLIERGIPFTEKTIDSNDDITALKKIAGSANLPLLTIGSQQISGFQDSNWSGYLTAAGYPPTSQLPGRYHRSPPAPLAPKSEAPAEAPAAATSAAAPAPQNESTPVAPPPDPNNPAGIRF